MAKKKTSGKKPAGWRKFDALTRKLIDVPKEEVDAQVETDRKQRTRKRRKK